MDENYNYFTGRIYTVTTHVPGTIVDARGVVTADQYPIYNPNDISNNAEPFRRGPWEYIEWRNPDCEDSDTLA